MQYVDLVFNTPIRQAFTYAFPEAFGQAFCSQRVYCQLGKQKQAVGLVIKVHQQEPVSPFKIKPIDSIIDHQAIIADELWEMMTWAADYYNHAIGEAIFSCLPVKMRQGKQPEYEPELILQPTGKAPQFPANATKLIEAFDHIVHETIKVSQKSQFNINKATLDKLIEKELVTTVEAHKIEIQTNCADKPVKLSHEQENVLNAVQFDRYQALLLQGITGSGKTEVFLQSIEQVLNQGKTALVLVPEIGLTPQTLSRFRRRFNARIESIHSQMTDPQRLNIWAKCQQQQVDILIGTRSAIFMPLPRLGIIIVDEEHDPSYKQQEGFRYHARDLACKRAHQHQVPIIMASATPSLESIANVKSGSFDAYYMHERHSGHLAPIKTVNMTTEPANHGVSHRLKAAIDHYLAKQQQVLLFINKRGFSPVLRCEQCGWLSECKHCDANMTYHKRSNQLRCHHCGAQGNKPNYCPSCLTGELIPLGVGTEKIEEWLHRQFPEKNIIRIDRDTASTKNKLEKRLQQIHDGSADIIIGTQMLAKGHHFKHLGLVGILDVDSAFFTADFRGSERLSQLILQVAGRAGRELKDSEVILQTHYPDHPLINLIQKQDYQKISEWLLQEREEAFLPPFRHQTVIRANSLHLNHALNFLQDVKQIIHHQQEQLTTDQQQPIKDPLSIIGPMPAPIEKRAGKYRCYLILEANQRSSLRNALQTNMHLITQSSFANKVRWHIDVDPKELL